ncbi:hypothetical protein [Embleya sp. NBC_00896]|uniref:hypothetical protein n=1 Tax=Embleya sp. NBC_00896 TaxID=2975961 RepID=UPI0038684BD8|nr:hypothetical protein OG928_17245 [Embleya sp. NBC_00896]
MALITLLVLTNVYGPAGDVQARRDGSTPSPAEIPPQLPAQDQSTEATPGQAGVTTPVPGASPAPGGQTLPGPTVTVTTTATVTAPPANASGPDNRPQSGSSSSTPNQPPGGSTVGGTGGNASTPPPTPGGMRVTDVRIASDRGNGSYVKCDGLDQVYLAGTVLVDGGVGDVVYQWVFDRVFRWPQDILHFTGSGPRQQTLQVPWRVPATIGGVSGTIELLIYQPIANAQTERYSFNFVCKPLLSLS